MGTKPSISNTEASTMNPRKDNTEPSPELDAENADAPRTNEALRTEETQQAESVDETAVLVSVEEYARLQALAAERDDYLNRLQRAVADCQNLQKRLTRLDEVASRNAVREVALRVVPLADSFAHALKAAEEAEGVENLREGLALIEKEFYNILSGLGIVPIKAAGRPFDPHYHEAVFQEPAEGAEPNTVLRELKKGFVMGDLVIRPSQVSVAAPSNGQ